MEAVLTIIRFGYVPFMLVGLNVAGLLVVANGWSYAWLLVVLGIAFAASHLAERLLPHFEEWNGFKDDSVPAVVHAIVYEQSSINGILLIPIVTLLFPSLGLWPTHWPLLAQLLLAIVATDFAFTLVHYYSHRWSILWRLHAVHHGSIRLNGLNGLMRHPLHQTLDMVVGTMPLVIAGMPVDVAIVLGLAISIQLMLQHSNVAFELGSFRNWLPLGELHRIHHVNWGKEGDCNFGLFMTLWDRMLGTFCPVPPRTIKVNDMGISDAPDFPRSSYLQQLLFPLRYPPH